jgi:uncharacterized RmlC-like cupin family protein
MARTTVVASTASTAHARNTVRNRAALFTCRHPFGSRHGSSDYIFVPPHVPHREENPDTDDAAVIVIARNTR